MRLLSLVGLGLCLLLFTASATTDLALPGPQDDESRHAVLAIDLLRPEFPYSKDYTLHIGPQPFPFGVNSHTGALKAYLLWPLFALFGPSVELLRLFTVFLGLITLLFFYLFAKEVAGPWAAFWAAFLLSLDSAFIFYAKLDAGPIMEELLWFMLCLWGFVKWKRTGKMSNLILGLVSVCLGMYSHITFIWVVMACGIAALLFYRDALLKISMRPAIYYAIFAAVCASVVFLYWLVGEKKIFVWEAPGLSGAFVMFERLSTQGGILTDVLLGRHTGEIRPLPNIRWRPLTDIFLTVSTLFLIWGAGRRLKRARFLLLAAAILFVEICLTPKGFTVLTYHRMMPLYMILIFFGGWASVQNWTFLKHPGKYPAAVRGASLVFFLLAVLSLWGQVILKQEADREIRRTGGKEFWSDGIYVVANTLKREEWEKTICFDWGYPSLILLTQGQIPISGPPWLITVDEATKHRRLLQLIRETSARTLFLLNPVRKYRGSVTVPELQETAEAVNKHPVLEHLFYDREGDPIYAAYTVQAKHL